ncbi:MAG TPA: ABC transporter substrate-binding protein, partial [Burkholderiaceae bacterium]|nr:ABC transporter substrate-binding protein [Burkholderiaceae bacterium]
MPRTASVAGLPLQLAGDLGYLDAEGLDVQWVPVASDVAAAQALASGRVQAAAIEYTQVLAQRARGVELSAVVLQT